MSLGQEKQIELEAKIASLEEKMIELLTPIGSAIVGAREAIEVEEEIDRLKGWLETGIEPPSQLDLYLKSVEGRKGEPLRQDNELCRKAVVGGFVLAAAIYYTKG